MNAVIIGQTILWAAIGFFSASLMFSYWLSRAVLRIDLRAVGDGNPGATNAMIAGGRAFGILAAVLDIVKGAIPVFIARYIVGLAGAPLAIVALVTPLGHAYSPWLGFKGGKALAVIGGVWTGLTIWEAPTLGGIALGVWFSVVEVSGWTVIFMMLTMGAYYAITNPDPALLLTVFGHTALLAWKYRTDLRRFPTLRPWIVRRVWRR